MDKVSDRERAPKEGSGLTRRSFLKWSGVAAVAGVASEASAGAPADGKRMAMVIDLARCTGCGGCLLTCKNENNVQAGHAWSSRITRTSGKFPDVSYEYIPTLCNHCEKAPCIRICPTGAMHKCEGNVTAHEPAKCIGCKNCMAACPYGVISYNSCQTHAFWRTKKPLIKGSTDTASDVGTKANGEVVPYYNPDREAFRRGSGLRSKGIVEKCTLCDHRLKEGKVPYCVDRCPASARVIGDLNDPKSAVSQLLGKYTPWRLKEHLGTEPKVFYVRSFNPANHGTTKGAV
ncbi:MAG: 4Fe-4S dicluster domain-containing protein [Planctomycetota bacterium]|jgi:molybdopterin-containing oxidoreductase family iron-sulfur binding subunit